MFNFFLRLYFYYFLKLTINFFLLHTHQNFPKFSHLPYIVNFTTLYSALFPITLSFTSLSHLDCKYVFGCYMLLCQTHLYNFSHLSMFLLLPLIFSLPHKTLHIDLRTIIAVRDVGVCCWAEYGASCPSCTISCDSFNT